jgi:hypothetical protein
LTSFFKRLPDEADALLTFSTSQSEIHARLDFLRRGTYRNRVRFHRHRIKKRFLSPDLNNDRSRAKRKDFAPASYSALQNQAIALFRTNSFCGNE